MGKYQRIFLIGPRAAGKTSIGKELSVLLGCNFLDCDLMLEQQICKNISELIREFGEDYFRKQESLLLEKISSISNTVVATGGGCILNSRNRQVLKQNGLVCYLQVNQQEQLQRLSHISNKALLPDDIKLRAEYLSKCTYERQAYYEQTANLIIDTSGADVKFLAQMLQQLIAESLCIS